MRKYKRFFQVPLNKLPWRLPLRKKKKEDARQLHLQENKRTFSRDFTQSSDNRGIDEKLFLEILRIIQQHRYGNPATRKNAPLVLLLSSRVGRAGFPSPPISYERLDELYTDLAPQVHICTNLQKKGLSLPVVEYGYENYDPPRHEINRVNFKRMVVDPHTPFKDKLGKMINFQVPQHHYYINVPCGIGRKTFPDICLLIDTSGSMREGGYHVGIPWGEKSGYHYALLGLYGIVKYLESQQIAPSILWNVINFSDITRASGWKSYSEIYQLKKHALTPQFGGTEIDVEILREELTREPCLLIMLSDGEIYNWDKIKDQMEEIIRPHYTCFIQIGKETRVGRDMQEFGAMVLNVKKKEDIATLMVDITKQVRHSL